MDELVAQSGRSHTAAARPLTRHDGRRLIGHTEPDVDDLTPTDPSDPSDPVDRPRSRRDRFRLAVHLSTWGCLLGVVVVLLLQFVDEPSIRVAILQSFTPWMPVAAVVAVAAACLLRADRAGAAGSALTLVSLAAVTPVAWADDLPAPMDGASPFSVATANVLYSNERIAEVGDLLVDLDVDAIALVEITPSALAELETHPLSELFPHRVDRPGWAASGLAIWSRYPVTALPDRGFGPRIVEADIEFTDASVRVVAAHPPPPVSDRELWISEMSNLPAIAAGDDPVVILGDFNASFFHPPFRHAVDEAGLIDAAAATGDGLAMTWPSHGLIPAFVTIDHVLFGGGLTALDADVVAIPGSDHHAVIAELALSG